MKTNIFGKLGGGLTITMASILFGFSSHAEIATMSMTYDNGGEFLAALNLSLDVTKIATGTYRVNTITGNFQGQPITQVVQWYSNGVEDPNHNELFSLGGNNTFFNNEGISFGVVDPTDHLVRVLNVENYEINDGEGDAVHLKSLAVSIPSAVPVTQATVQVNWRDANNVQENANLVIGLSQLAPDVFAATSISGTYEGYKIDGLQYVYQHPDDEIIAPNAAYDRTLSAYQFNLFDQQGISFVYGGTHLANVFSELKSNSYDDFGSYETVDTLGTGSVANVGYAEAQVTESFQETPTINSGPGGFLHLPGGVPEPSSWALMLVGVAGLGGSLRGRRAFASGCRMTAKR